VFTRPINKVCVHHIYIIIFWPGRREIIYLGMLCCTYHVHGVVLRFRVSWNSPCIGFVVCYHVLKRCGFCIAVHFPKSQKQQHVLYVHPPKWRQWFFEFDYHEIKLVSGSDRRTICRGIRFTLLSLVQHSLKCKQCTCIHTFVISRLNETNNTFF